MKKALMITAVLSLSVCTSQVAEPAAGGLPGLDARVGTLEDTVAEQGTAGVDLQSQVDGLEAQLSAVQNELSTLENKLPMFAVVDADGTRIASRGVQSARQSVDGSGNPVTGHYDVVFERSVAKCAATVTVEPSFSGALTASINGTFRGIPNPNRSENTFLVVLSDEDQKRTNSRFNIIVVC